MSYDRDTKVLSGTEAASIYDEDETLGQFLLRNLRKNPSQIVQTNHDDGAQITAGEMAAFGCRIAKSLSKELKFGDVVGLTASNTNYVAPLALGCFLSGISISTTDTSFDSKEIAHIFGQTKPKMVFCDHDKFHDVIEALKLCNIDCAVITIDRKVLNVRFIAEFLEVAENEPEFVTHSFGLKPSSLCAVILCSSGTTGLSKGVMLSHTQCIEATVTGPVFVTLVCFSSVYWYSGFTGLMQSLSNNINRVITREAFTPQKLVETVEQRKVNVIVAPPLQYEALLQSEDVKRAYFTSVWVTVVSGGRFDTSSREALKKYLPYGFIRFLYGITECGVLAATTPVDPLSDSCGKIVSNMKLKVVDEDGKALNVGDTGEFYVLSKSKFLGYSNNPEESANAFDADGWFITGDLGYFTEDGEVFIVGRKKEVFDYMNHFIYPSELEKCIEQMEGVKQVCVVGICLSNTGSLGAAVVVKEAGSEITEDDIEDEVKKNFIPLKWLYGGAYFVDSLPRTASGKVKRMRVKEEAERMFKVREAES